MLVRSVSEADKRIKEIINLMKHDLDLVTSEGAVIQTSQFLMSNNSPFLKKLLTDTAKMSSPAKLYLPEISAASLRHLINILKKGFTTGKGSGDYIVKEMKIAAKVLGFKKFPALVFMVGMNPPEDISSEIVQHYLQREIEANRIEDGDIEVLVEEDDGNLNSDRYVDTNNYKDNTEEYATIDELLDSFESDGEDDVNLNNHPQHLEEREPSGFNGAGQPLVSIIQNILQDIESETNEETSQKPAAKQINKDGSPKETPKILYSTGSGNNRIKAGKKMLRVRPIETLLLNPVQNQKAVAHPRGVPTSESVLGKKRCQVKLTDISSGTDKNVNFGASSSRSSQSARDINSNREAPTAPITTIYALSRTLVNKRKISSIQSQKITDEQIPMTDNICNWEQIVDPRDAPLQDYQRVSQAPLQDYERVSQQWMRKNQSKKKCVVEILDQTNHWSQEVTEITPIVLKVEGDDHGNQPMIHCGVCRKAFTNAGSLLSHSLKHDEYIGERKCTVCPFKGTKTTLLTHIRFKHTKEKLFHCSMCPKTFSSCSLKKSHEKTERLMKKIWH